MKKTIKDLDQDDRPREKLIKYGADLLTDEELLAIIIATGNKEKNVIELSKEILDTFSYEDLADIEVAELTHINGIKNAKACSIVASLRLGKRIAQKVMEREIIKIEKSEDIYNYLKNELANKKNEYFYAILLNTKNVIISKEVISKGTLDASLVHPREAFKAAIKKSAKSIIFVHNHPSGDVNPSKHDFLTTRNLVDAGNILDIKVLDHIIIGDNDYYSFKKENLI
ncbi:MULTISPECIES: DNA repair protein RadC [Anaerococcus]|uniref:RadC family protein n=1 Tax=Anaerococcus TaxID=165779 RepID=UPI001AE82A0B|nr:MULTISPECIES: DNA repair protein RadC [Anaerococcus]MBP2069297.1 DNA repair protein RadC [Anaerococcus nagyae]MDU1829275.1 DNA repair protein RadC [Anaerococcus sp.]MDU1865312.1 DNA repair protein RadC [Anaerococcus sp.]MDU2353551.1 DNA repair protein RadC [Anaerococcus sp.]MDU2565945.1 DNA repair protein RadC [Anaerococcus sp.]